jgi:HEAT repeat protein
MDENSQILSGNISSGTLERRNNLYFLISGEKYVEANDARVSRVGHEPRIFKRMKDIALLFLFSKNPSGGPVVQKICLCSMELGINLKNKPLLWLGSSGDEESVTRLKEVFPEANTSNLKRDLVEAIALHQRSKDVSPFLSGLLTGKESDDVRAKAAFWLGEQSNPEGMKLLMDAAEKDQSLKVREETVFAISRIESNESLDNLISLARSADNPKVRGKAAFWLGQKASQKAVATLETIIADDEDTEVQRQALFALSQNTDKEGVDRLINVAKNHPNRRIRKQAIQILSQSEDPRALETLIAIVRN